MKKSVRKYTIFTIIALMAYVLLRGVLLFCSNDVYLTDININGKYNYLYHKNISCEVAMQNLYKGLKPDTETHAVPVKLNVAEQIKGTMCWHCTWEPIIVYGFLEVVLIGLLLLFIKENKP